MKIFIDKHIVSLFSVLVFHHLALQVIQADEKGKDTTKTYYLGEVVVTATRLPTNPKNLPSSVEVIRSSNIEKKNGTSLASVLEGRSGLFLKSYGGSGALQTPSIRGMAAEHTLVLVDGQRYNNFQNGQVDWGIYLLDEIERIEIVKGGYSAIYGADALGGVVNIITKHPGATLGLGAELSRGSYEYQRHGVHATYGLGRASMQLSLRRERGRGDYEFYFHDGLTTTKMRRQGADFSILQSHFGMDYSLSPIAQTSLNIRYGDAERGTPGAVVTTASNGQARQSDKDLMTQMDFLWNFNPTVLLHVGSSFHYSDGTYIDPGLIIGGKILESFYTNRLLSFTPHVRFSPLNTFSLIIGAELARGSIISNEVISAVRWQKSLFLSAEKAFEFPHEILYNIILYPSLRYDTFSDVDGDLSPKIGINIGVLREPSVHLRSSYGKNFRVPTFNDLYWKVGGNPNLHPERSVSFDAGIVTDFNFVGLWEAEVSYFNIDTEDRIVWMPGSNSIWSPKNIHHVKSTGIELKAEWRSMSEAFVLGYAHTISNTIKKNMDGPDDQTANKQLPYLPTETAAFNGSLNYGAASLNIHHVFTGFRYITETNDPKFVLPAFQKTDVNLILRIPFEHVIMKTKFEVNNLFNADYQIIASYPMPLRTYVATLEVQY